jgi:toxin ParE1/3/4
VTRVRWTPEAADQLEIIVRRLRKENPAAARSIARRILGRIEELRTFPQIGRPGELPGTRELVASPDVIVYRLKYEAAEILHIWHGAQDWR